MASQYRFNLLKKKQTVFQTQLLAFFNKYVRYMLIMTQLVVLLVFFSKILLDQRIVDLKEGIDQKNQIIKAAGSMIAANNRLATQIEQMSALNAKERASSELIMTVLENVPESIRIESVAFSQNSLVLEGTTYRPIDIKRFETRLKKKFPDATVVFDSITINSQRYEFQISVHGKKV